MEAKKRPKATAATWIPLRPDLRLPQAVGRVAWQLAVVGGVLGVFIELVPVVPAQVLVSLGLILFAMWLIEGPKRRYYEALTTLQAGCRTRNQFLADIIILQDGVVTGKDSALVYLWGSSLFIKGLRTAFALRRDSVEEVEVPVKIGTDRYFGVLVAPSLLVGFKQFDRFPMFRKNPEKYFRTVLDQWILSSRSPADSHVIPPKELLKEVRYTWLKVAYRAFLFSALLWLLYKDTQELFGYPLSFASFFFTMPVEHLKSGVHRTPSRGLLELGTLVGSAWGAAIWWVHAARQRRRQALWVNSEL